MSTVEFMSQLRDLGVRVTLQDESLRCLAPKGVLSADLQREIQGRKPEVIAFLRRAGTIVPKSSMQPVPRTGEGLPLSFAQQRLWVVQQLAPAGSLFNIPAVLRLRGALDVASLERALGEIVRRHETLRTTFRESGSGPLQFIGEPSLHLPRIAARDADDAMRLASEESRREFDLTTGPLFRPALIRIAADEHLLTLTMHHIVSDGWSLGVLVEELAALYENFRRGMASPLDELEMQYADFAVWQRRSAEEGSLHEHIGYWRQRLAGAPEMLELPADRPRPAAQSYRGAKEQLTVAASTLERVKELARAEGATLFMTLLAAFDALLHRITGAEDIVVGTPVAGRNRAEIEPLVGFFVNMLPLRVQVGGAMTFRRLVRDVRDAAIDAFAHQDAPFDQVVEVLRPQRDLSHHPIFQVNLVLQSAQPSLAGFRSLDASWTEVVNPVEKFDLTIECEERRDGLRLQATYNADLFDASTMARLLTRFELLLAAAVATPDRAVAALPLVGAAELEELERWGESVATYPRHATVHGLLDAQAEKQPDQIALVAASGQSLTYGELADRATRLAYRLAGAGVGPESPVAVVMDRSLDAAVALLGVLKAGGVYVPIDPAYPRERIAQTMADARVCAAVTSQRWRDAVPAFGGPVVVVDDGGEAPAVRLPDVTADSLAYIVYTSGSTGRPKGVAVPHRGIVRLLVNNDYFELGDGETMIHYAPLVFDATTLELWRALLNGGRVVIVPGGASLDDLADAIVRHGVTTVCLTTGLFHAMVEERIDAFAGVRQALSGGDVLSPEHVKRLFAANPAIRIVNGYGPTESTTLACCEVMTAADAGALGAGVPIGKPIRNTRVRILDAHLQPVPMGVAGELCIGGDGLARHYAGQPALTAEKFVPDPVRCGERLYRSGDRARWRADGRLEFLGRIDQQVKIRGYRVEPAEIETVLAGDARVKECVVVARGAASQKSLVAYVVPAIGGLTAAMLRESLGRHLPPFMIPSQFVFVDAIPLTNNGKVDRRRLPEPEPAHESARVHVAPRNVVERVVAGIWADVLEQHDPSVDHDFFESGGHSLLATRLVARLRSTFRTPFSLATVFESPTIAGLSAALGSGGKQGHIERIAEVRERLQNMSAEELAERKRRRGEREEL